MLPHQGNHVPARFGLRARPSKTSRCERFREPAAQVTSHSERQSGLGNDRQNEECMSKIGNGDKEGHRHEPTSQNPLADSEAQTADAVCSSYERLLQVTKQLVTADQSAPETSRAERFEHYQPPVPEPHAEVDGAGPERNWTALRATFLCTSCWSTFGEPEYGTQCVNCGRTRPPEGWSTLPHQFNARLLLLEEIGRGAMGVVFRARETRDTLSNVAVKVCKTADTADRDALLRTMFDRERRATALTPVDKDAVSRVVVAREFVESDPCAHLVMDYVPWPTLYDILEQRELQRDPIPQRVTCGIGIELASALELLHHRRLVHNDLKPGNIFVATDGLWDANAKCSVRIMDWGACSPEPAETPRTLPLDSDDPGIGGTWTYMSPEQIAFILKKASPAEPLPVPTSVDARSDQYALAAILWKLQTFGTPHPVVTSKQLPTVEFLRHRLTTLKTVPPIPIGMHPALYRVLSRALAFSPADRYPTPRDLRKDLQQTWHEIRQDGLRRASNLAVHLSNLLNDSSEIRSLLGLAAGIHDTLSETHSIIAAAQGCEEELDFEDIDKKVRDADRSLRHFSRSLAQLAGPDKDSRQAPKTVRQSGKPTQTTSSERGEMSSRGSSRAHAKPAGRPPPITMYILSSVLLILAIVVLTLWKLVR